MTKIIVEDRTNITPIRENLVLALSEALYYSSAQTGAEAGMTTAEMVAAIILTAADATMYTKLIGTVDEQELAEIESRVAELIRIRKKDFEDRGIASLRQQAIDKKKKANDKPA